MVLSEYKKDLIEDTNKTQDKMESKIDEEENFITDIGILEEKEKIVRNSNYLI